MPANPIENTGMEQEQFSIFVDSVNPSLTDFFPVLLKNTSVILYCHDFKGTFNGITMETLTGSVASPPCIRLN